jgi:hypothetical protein
MKTARKKPTVANLRGWRVIIIRSKGEYLGSVETPDRQRAEAVAIKTISVGHGPAQPAADPGAGRRADRRGSG